ncbi:MAG: mandelate racemase/muconate lactonizing enzyme family protein [Thermoplasmatota archaeon]|nr:hypothetical protein [Halobacteriales archaeon]
MTWSFHPYTIPLARPYSWAKGVQTVRRGLLVSCTIDGATGWGEVAPAPHLDVDPSEIANFARKSLRVALAQEDVPAALDAANCGPRLRCGLAGAWLDAQARLAGRSLAAFIAQRVGLPAAAERVPVNALIPIQEPAACAEEAVRAVAAGFRTLKLKSDGDIDRDVARLEAVQAAVGKGVALRLDANESYAATTALSHLRRLEPFALEYVEQPVPAVERSTLVEMLHESPVPIALDESATSWQAVAPLVGFHPVAILKPQRLGGVDRAADFIAHARDARLRCVVTNSLETAVGRAHALHAAALLPEPLPACGLATEGFLARDVSRFEVKDGWLALPPGPGLGVAPEMEASLAAAVE